MSPICADYVTGYGDKPTGNFQKYGQRSGVRPLGVAIHDA